MVAGALFEPGGDDSVDETVSLEGHGDASAVGFGEGTVLGSGGETETLGRLMEADAPAVSVADDSGKTFWGVLGGSGHVAGDLVVEVSDLEGDLAGLEKQGAGLASIPDSPFSTGGGGELGDGWLKSIAAVKAERKLTHII